MKGVPGARDAMAAPSGADGRSGRGGRGSSGAARDSQSGMSLATISSGGVGGLLSTGCTTPVVYTKHAMFVFLGPWHRGDACLQDGRRSSRQAGGSAASKPPMTMPSRARVSAT